MPRVDDEEEPVQLLRHGSGVGSFEDGRDVDEHYIGSSSELFQR
jgi:hypothetical protein